MEFNTSPSLYQSSSKKSTILNSESRRNIQDKMRKYSEEIKNNSRLNDSQKKINNYFENLNKKDPKIFQIIFPKTNLKSDKDNFIKRLKLNIPLTKSAQIKKNEDKLFNNKEEEKNKLMNNLIYSSDINLIQEYQRKKKEELSSKEYKRMKNRMEVLKNNNINIINLFPEEKEKKIYLKEGKNNQVENKRYDNLISEEEKKNNNNNSNNINNLNYNTFSNIKKSQLLSSKIKNKNQSNLKFSKTFNLRKPIVNSLEFCVKIKEYLKNKTKKPNENNNNFNSIKLSYRNNSFPKKSNTVISKKEKINSQKNNKSNSRGKDEVYKFIKEQNEKRKENEKKLKNEENKKDLHYYLNFAKLQQSIDNKKKKIKILKCNKKNNKKIINKYFIGNSLSNNYLNISNNSKSTILDKNDLLNEIYDSIKIIKSANREEKNLFVKDKNNDYIINQKNINNNDNNYKNQHNKDIDDKNNSFDKEMLNAEKTIKKSINIVNENNLGKYLKEKNKKL